MSSETLDSLNRILLGFCKEIEKREDGTEFGFSQFIFDKKEMSFEGGFAIGSVEEGWKSYKSFNYSVKLSKENYDVVYSDLKTMIDCENENYGLIPHEQGMRVIHSFLRIKNIDDVLADLENNNDNE